jgi:hypothetical protein
MFRWETFEAPQICAKLDRLTSISIISILGEIGSDQQMVKVMVTYTKTVD